MRISDNHHKDFSGRTFLYRMDLWSKNEHLQADQNKEAITYFHANP
jgi:hypothetical protein